MDIVLISAFATACVVTAIEGLLFALGKWRGLVALIFSTIGSCFMWEFDRYLPFEILASTFIGLTASLLVESWFMPAQVSRLPRRTPKL